MKRVLVKATIGVLTVQLAALALCGPRKAHAGEPRLIRTNLFEKASPPQKAPTSLVLPETAEKAKLRKTIRKALERGKANGIVRTVEKAATLGGCAPEDSLLRSFHESKIGEDLENPFSTALGDRQITNATGAAIVRACGRERLADLRKLSPAIVQPVQVVLGHIEKLEKEGGTRLADFNDALRGARTAAEAQGVPPAVFEALRTLRLNPAVCLLQDSFREKELADLQDWMGDFASPYLTHELLGVHFDQFGSGNVRKLISALKETPRKTMGQLFSNIFPGNAFKRKMSVAAYVKEKYEDYQAKRSLLKQEYAVLNAQPDKPGRQKKDAKQFALQ